MKEVWYTGVHLNGKNFNYNLYKCAYYKTSDIQYVNIISFTRTRLS